MALEIELRFPILPSFLRKKSTLVPKSMIQTVQMISADVQVLYQRRQRTRGHLGNRISGHGQVLKCRIKLKQKENSAKLQYLSNKFNFFSPLIQSYNFFPYLSNNIFSKNIVFQICTRFVIIITSERVNFVVRRRLKKRDSLPGDFLRKV